MTLLDDAIARAFRDARKRFDALPLDALALWGPQPPDAIARIAELHAQIRAREPAMRAALAATRPGELAAFMRLARNEGMEIEWRAAVMVGEDIDRRLGARAELAISRADERKPK